MPQQLHLKSTNMKKIIISILLLISSLAQGATYYVSNSGNDLYSGLTPSTAWRTISKVNSSTINAGDSVLFQAGGVWREALTVRPGSSGTNNQVVYGRYGSGNNPQILGSNQGITWTATATTNVWQSATSFTTNPWTTYPTEIFFINSNDSVTWGDYETYTTNFTNLNNEFEWTWYNNTIYIYATSDPDSRYSSVEVPQRNYCIAPSSNSTGDYIEINGIDFKFSRFAGYYSGYPEVYTATNLSFKNCRIGYIGSKGATHAYGVEIFHKNFLVDNCYFSDCGRRAISFNLYTTRPSGQEMDISNVVVRNSTFKRGYHTTSLDLAMTSSCVGDTITDIYFYNNTVDDSEVPMVGNDYTSNQIFTQEQGGYINNVYIYNNVFKGATARNILLEDGDTVHIWNNTILGHNLNTIPNPYSMVGPSALVVDYKNNITYDPLPDNSIQNYGVLVESGTSNFLNRDYNLYFQLYPNNSNSNRAFTGYHGGYWNTNQWSSYRSSNPTFDAHSPSPANPLFTSDYKLSATSTAIEAGTPISSVLTDKNGVARDINTPSIGAYEYVQPITITASSGQESNPNNVYDHNTSTTVTNYYEPSYLQFYFPDGITLDRIGITFVQGIARTYSFSIQSSTNGSSWNTVFTGSSAGATFAAGGMESFSFNQITTNYIRIVGNGSNVDGGDIYSEVSFPQPSSELQSSLSPDSVYNILFLGNSFTENNYVPYTVQSIASSAGWKTPYVRYNAIGGATLTNHINSTASMALVDAGNWDYLVLQDNSTRWQTDSAGMADDVAYLYERVKHHSPNCRVILYSTWATITNQEALYNTWNPEYIEDYYAQQAEITAAYQNASLYEPDSIKVAHVGDAWAASLASGNHVRLHLVDDRHPSVTGSYLASLVLYNAIFEENLNKVGYWNVTDAAYNSFIPIVNNLTTISEQGQEVPSSENDIISFSIPNQVTRTINPTDHVVIVTMPYGVSLSSLTPTIGISSGATITPSSGVAQNFTDTVHYYVTSSDLTVQRWIISVYNESPSQETDILTFTIPSQLGSSVLNTAVVPHTVTVTIPHAYPLTSLIPTITLSPGATINPLSGVQQNFTNMVSYIVTAQDMNTMIQWNVTVVNATEELPTVSISLVKSYSKIAVFNITADPSGGDAITARGLCWSTSQNPTIRDSYTNDGTDIGTFRSVITELLPNTIYYVRGYATNSIGTGYSNQIVFMTTKQTIISL